MLYCKKCNSEYRAYWSDLKKVCIFCGSTKVTVKTTKQKAEETKKAREKYKNIVIDIAPKKRLI